MLGHGADASFSSVLHLPPRYNDHYGDEEIIKAVVRFSFRTKHFSKCGPNSPVNSALRPPAHPGFFMNFEEHEERGGQEDVTIDMLIDLIIK